MVRNTITWFLIHALCNTVISIAKASEWDSYPPEPSPLDSFDVRSETSCDNYEMTMRCSPGDVIQVLYAEYGRRTRDKCSGTPAEMENTECSLGEALNIVSNRCSNKTRCNFNVTPQIFPDPCPGTGKYLITKFKCVRYLFSCPGALTGIGGETSSVIDISPKPATWTKDPLFKPDHVFLALEGLGTVDEYSSWSDFEQGNKLTTYNLPSRIAGGRFVVYDGVLYYFEEKSHKLIKFNLVAGAMTKQTVITDSSAGMKRLQNISLSVDEHGLWVVYTRGNALMGVKKLNMESLSTIKTWTIHRRRSQYSHTFVICGIVYGVGRRSGTVEFSFNTNKNSPTAQRVSLPFDNSRNNFLRYNPLAVSYNPREQILYSWDADKGNAITYKLHFDGIDPAVVPKTTRSTTTTSTTSTTTTSKKNIFTSIITSTASTTEPTPPYLPGSDVTIDRCPQVMRNGILWPDTGVDEEARVECPSRSGAFATWRCERDASTRWARWSVAGPDLSRCNTWVGQIDQQFKSGLIVVSTAFKSLAMELAEEGPNLSVSVPEITGLVNKLLEHPTVPSQEEAKSMAESISSISTSVLSNEEAMSSMSGEEKSTVAVSLMNATAKACFLYADTVAQTPPDMRKSGSGSVVIASDAVVTEINVRERVLNLTELSGMTSFPNAKVCDESSTGCRGDLIEIPTTEIMSMRVTGPAIILFALYNNLSQYLDSSSGNEWQIDSRVISATLQHHNYHTSLRSPAVITLHHTKPSSSPHRCVYWDFQASYGKGNWSSEGCSLKSSNLTHSICECDHLTSFAVLVNHAGSEASIEDDRALDIITKVGISISMLCLILCIATFAYFRNLHSDRNSVHKHLCICLLVAETIFLFGINQTGNEIACSVIAAVLHYFFLAAFMWMAVEGFLLYVMLVEVFETESRWKWYYLCGYGVPAIIVGIAAAVDYSGYGTDDSCWLSLENGFIWSFVGPVLAIIVANIFFLSIAVYKMYVHSVAFTDIGKINSIKASVRGASVLLCLLGITWAFGILWINDNIAVLAYLFCIFNAFQGMFIFIFHCILPRKVRQEYRRFFSRLPCCDTFGGNSYLSDSSSFSKKYTPGRYPVVSGLTNNVTLQQSQLRRMWTEAVAPRNSDELITSEITRNGEPTHTIVSMNRSGLHYSSDRNYLQEDEVFLPPPSHDARNKFVLNRTREDLQYDRLQHHHHPEDYIIFPGKARPLGDFGTGKLPQRDHFGQIIESEHQTPRMGIKHLANKPITPSNIRESVTGDFAGCRNWNSRRMLQNPSNPFRRSLDENCNGKRDSGIVLQRHPSMSGMPNNQQGYHRRSLDNVLADFHSKESDYIVTPGPIKSNRSHRLSLDNLQRPRLSSSYRMSPPKTSTQSPKRATLQSMSVAPANGNWKRKSLSSDSDDPIVTDCSVSSACSSSGNRAPVSTVSPLNISQYEEPICRQSRHRDETNNRGQDRSHKCRHSDPTDENDLEVELITNSDGSVDPRSDTLGYPPYRPPTPPSSHNPPKPTPRFHINQRSDFFKHHDFASRHQHHGIAPLQSITSRPISGL